MLPPLPPVPKLEPPKVQWSPPDYPINPEKNSDFRVMLARFPGDNREHPDSSGYYMGILPQLLRDDRISDIIPWRKSSTPITMVRNLCIREAIQENCDYVLMIDNDMAPDSEPDGEPFWHTAWSFMMARRAREAVNCADIKPEWFNFDEWWKRFPPCATAAPYCGDPPREQPYAMRWKELGGTDDVDGHFKMTYVDRHDAARRTGIGEAPAMPTGLILYDTRLFYYLPPPWFDYEYEDGYQTERVTTEDVYQTRNMSLLGMPVYCAWDCWSGHWKPKLVRKPRPIAVETVRGSLREAFEKQVSVNEKLHFRHPDSASTP
jgi:hypothetical protein